MWVWSDELVERLPSDDGEGWERVPLVAYAVRSDADLDEFASKVLIGERAPRPAPREAVGR